MKNKDYEVKYHENRKIIIVKILMTTNDLIHICNKEFPGIHFDRIHVHSYYEDCYNYTEIHVTKESSN